jgi:hypothetical protein
MSNSREYYTILGILPSADPVVIVAAYRALASRYHPDKWRGSADEANSRMAEINVAYAVLSDASKRAEYDQLRRKGRGDFEAEQDSSEEAFDSALNELGERWAIAVSIYPEMETSRKELAKTAHRLAFAFVTLILETKGFQQSRKIADRMHIEFLERYFGSNPLIVAFAKELISEGMKKAIVDLNRYVDVFGDAIDASAVIKKVSNDHQYVTILARREKIKAEARRKHEAVLEQYAQQAEENRKLQDIRNLKRQISRDRKVGAAKALMDTLGYDISEYKSWSPFGIPTFVAVNRQSGGQTKFAHETEFLNWVVSSHCNADSFP